ncbi:unnamed protein product [Peniophora sp. CBMAI 1063]|nr:unnamed protein product [Peniophora sp. CBMAI 1063]
MGTTALNADVLLHVFHAVASNEPPSHLPIPDLAYPRMRESLHLPFKTLEERLGWVRLGHVSHVWRETLLSAQTLWADHIGTLPAGVDEMLARSGPTAPLSLHLPLWTTRSPIIRHLAAVLQSHSGTLPRRLRSVTIWDPCPVIEDSPAFRLSRDRRVPISTSMISLMNTLSTVRYSSNNNDIFPFSALGHILCEAELPILDSLGLFQHRPSWSAPGPVHARNLHHLHLNKCFITFPISNTLVSISITATSWQRARQHADGMIPLVEVLEVVERSAATLQRLELSDGVIALPPDFPQSQITANTNDPVRRINLPCLKVLKVHELAPLIWWLLSCLQYSRNAATYLTIRRVDPGLDNHLAVRAALRKYSHFHFIAMRFRDIYSEDHAKFELFRLPTDTGVGMQSPTRFYVSESSLFLSVSLESRSAEDQMANATLVHAFAKELGAAGMTVKQLAVNVADPSENHTAIRAIKYASKVLDIYLETNASFFLDVAYALRRHMDKHGPYRKICLIAGEEPKAYTKLGMMVLVFGQARLDATVLHVDRKFETMVAGEEMPSLLKQLEAIFREVIVSDF